MIQRRTMFVISIESRSRDYRLLGAVHQISKRGHPIDVTVADPGGSPALSPKTA